MTYPNKRCQHGWLDPSACETCKLLAEVTALRAAYIERAKEPVRAWVGLTDAEVTSLMYDCNALPECQPTDVELGNFAQAIEATLKAKNTPEETP